MGEILKPRGQLPEQGKAEFPGFAQNIFTVQASQKLFILLLLGCSKAVVPGNGIHSGTKPQDIKQPLYSLRQIQKDVFIAPGEIQFFKQPQPFLRLNTLQIHTGKYRRNKRKPVHLLYHSLQPVREPVVSIVEKINQIRQVCAELPLQHAGQPGIALKIQIKYLVSAGQKLAQCERKCGLKTPAYRRIDSDEMNVSASFPHSRGRKNSCIRCYFHNFADNIIHGLVFVYPLQSRRRFSFFLQNEKPGHFPGIILPVQRLPVYLLGQQKKGRPVLTAEFL